MQWVTRTTCDQQHSAASHASSALRCTGWQWNIQGGFNEWHIAKSLVIYQNWLTLFVKIQVLWEEKNWPVTLPRALSIWMLWWFVKFYIKDFPILSYHKLFILKCPTSIWFHSFSSVTIHNTFHFVFSNFWKSLLLSTESLGWFPLDNLSKYMLYGDREFDERIESRGLTTEWMW